MTAAISGMLRSIDLRLLSRRLAAYRTNAASAAVMLHLRQVVAASRLLSVFTGLLLAIGLGPFGAANLHADVSLIGVGVVPAKTADFSGLKDTLEGGFPHNRFGGISAIDYTGRDNIYVLLPDRGPSDGAVPYQCRFHTAEIAVQPGASPSVRFSLKTTAMFVNDAGQNYSGGALAFPGAATGSGLRFDPEGARCGPNHELFVSDEYGPSVFAFDKTGRKTGSFELPPGFLIANPSADRDTENASNSTGRQSNRGMEGLAISPDKTRLIGIMQGPLLQDSKPGASVTKRKGIHTRIVVWDLKTAATQQYVYSLDDGDYGISEVLCINNHELLVLERDGKAGEKADFKRVIHADLSAATDVSQIAEFSPKKLPDGVQAVSKKPFLDMFDPRFGFDRKSFPEKLEGLTFGPDLPDGRRLLLVTVDNDFEPRDTLIYAFAIDRADFPDFGWKFGD